MGATQERRLRKGPRYPRARCVQKAPAKRSRVRGRSFFTRDHCGSPASPRDVSLSGLRLLVLLPTSDRRWRVGDLGPNRYRTPTVRTGSVYPGRWTEVGEGCRKQMNFALGDRYSFLEVLRRDGRGTESRANRRRPPPQIEGRREGNAEDAEDGIPHRGV